MKLLSHQESISDELRTHNKVVLRCPMGVGANVSICDALTKVDGQSLIIDSLSMKNVWVREMAELGAKADYVTPEKLRLDVKNGIDYDYDNIVWNAFNVGEKTLEAVAFVANKARRIWIRHLRNPSALLKLKGPFHIVNLDYHGNSIYPVIKNDPAIVAKMQKYLNGSRPQGANS